MSTRVGRSGDGDGEQEDEKDKGSKDEKRERGEGGETAAATPLLPRRHRIRLYGQFPWKALRT
jgi:hypothetical protein